MAKYSQEELKKKLTPIQYHVTQEKGTEKPHSGEYVDHKEAGDYNCVICEVKLFQSDHKFNAHCGWPSFHKSSDAIEEHKDTSYGMVRTEVTCKHCNSHIGHVFDDSPYPGGLRYCINSASLKFKKGDTESK